MLQYVEATNADGQSLLEIYNYYLENTTVTFDHGGVSLVEFESRIHFGHARYKTFLINQDELCGFCFLTQFRKKPAYDKTAELGIYLKPQWTRRGWGREIVQYLEATAKLKKFEVLIASVSSENVASLSLFRKLGYIECAHYQGVAEKFDRKLDLMDFQKML